LLETIRLTSVACNVSVGIALNVIHHEWDVREEQHPYVCGANKQ